MESVGQKLREARLRSGLSLEDLGSSTRITFQSLAAIEADELSGFTRFHYKSFARQFAVAVHLEPNSLNEGIEAALNSMPETLVPGQSGTRARPKVAGMKPQRIHMARWVSSMALLVIMLVACSTFYSMWQNLRTRTVSRAALVLAPVPSKQNVVITAPRVVAGVLASKTPASSTVQPVPGGIAAAHPQPTNESDGEFHIQLAAIEKTWLSVVSDGKRVYSGTLNATETKTLEGRETARIRTGNAGGVQVTFNGKVIGLLGSEGQVRTVVFTKNGYEIVESEAAIAEPSMQSGGD